MESSEKIEALRKQLNDYNLPVSIHNIFDWIEYFIKKLQKYYPEEELKNGLKLIENDPTFIGVPKDAPSQLQYLLKIMWSQIILQRFFFYGFLKAAIESTNKFFPSNKYNNVIDEIYKKLIASKNFLENKNKAKILTAEEYELISDALKSQIQEFSIIFQNTSQYLQSILFKVFDDNLRTDSISGTHDLKLETQRLIFKNILNDIRINKLYNGKQSINYKCKLLWNLFKYTHPEIYNITVPLKSRSTAMTDEKARNNNLLKIIS